MKKLFIILLAIILFSSSALAISTNLTVNAFTKVNNLSVTGTAYIISNITTNVFFNMTNVSMNSESYVLMKTIYPYNNYTFIDYVTTDLLGLSTSGSHIQYEKLRYYYTDGSDTYTEEQVNSGAYSTTPLTFYNPNPLKLISRIEIYLKTNHAAYFTGEKNSIAHGKTYNTSTSTTIPIGYSKNLNREEYILVYSNNSYYDKIDYVNLTTSSLVHNFTGIYDTILNISALRSFDNSIINNIAGHISWSNTFNESYNETDGLYQTNLLKNLNYTVFINNIEYALSSNNYKSINITTSTYNQTFILYPTNSVNFTFLDENTKTQVTWDNISLELIGTHQSYNYTTKTGNTYPTLIVPDNYTVRYGSVNTSNPGFYIRKQYIVSITPGSTQDVTLYMTNSTNYANFTVNIVDEILNPVEGALVESLKYFIASNTYELSEIGITDYSGNTVLRIEPYTEYYKFIILYNGVVKKITNPAYITGSSTTIQIVLGGNYNEGFTNHSSILKNLTFNTATNNFRLDYIDVNGLSNQFCVLVYKVQPNSNTLVNTQCLTSASGTILAGVTASNNTLYTAKAFYYVDGEQNLLDSLSYQFPSSSPLSNMGLFIQIMLTLVILAITYWSIPVASIAVPMSLILGRMVGFNSIPIVYLIPLVVVGIVVAIITGNRS